MANVTITGTTLVGVYTFGQTDVTLINQGYIDGSPAAIISHLDNDSVVNLGTIGKGSANHTGVILSSGGSVTNQSSGTINTGLPIDIRGDAGTVVNAGVLNATNTGLFGVRLTAGGSVSNLSTGVISAGGAGVYLLSGGSVTNAAGGSITGYRGIISFGTATDVVNAGLIQGIVADRVGVELLAGGFVTNQAGGTISGRIGIFGANAATTVDNAGVVEGDTLAIGSAITTTLTLTNRSTGTIIGSAEFDKGGSFTNEAGGTISGSESAIGGAASVTVTVDNAGVIKADNLALNMSGSLVLTNRSTGTITGHDVMRATTVAMTVENFGLLSAERYAILMAGGGSVTNAVGGTITANQAVYRKFGGGTIVNAGSIHGSTTGVVLHGDGSFTNQASGVITGGAYGVNGGVTPVDVLNAGSIGGGYGVFLDHGGTVSNLSGGVISGFRGVEGVGLLTVVNAGIISGGTNIYGGSAAGVWTYGSSTITNQAGGTIKGDAGIGGRVDGTSAGSPIIIVNAGRIEGKAAASVLGGGGLNSASSKGVFLPGGSTLTNLAGGVVTAYQAVFAKPGSTTTVVNAGSIGGAASGIVLQGGGLVSNETGGVISGGVGIAISGAPGTISNAGMVTGTGGTAVTMAAGFANRLIVDSGASFTGQVDGGNAIGAGVVSTLELVSSASAGTLTGLGTQFVDFGRVQVDARASWTIPGSFAGIVSNGGTIAGVAGSALTFMPGFANRLIVHEGASFAGTVDGGNTLGATVASTLELAARSSPGTLSGLGSQFVNFERVRVDAGGTWTLPDPIAGTLVNAGTIVGTAGTAVAMTAGVNNRVIVQGNAEFVGVVEGGNTIGATAVSTLELAGTGTLAALNAQFADFAAITVDSGANWVLDGSTTIDAGVTLTNHGTLATNGPLTNAGAIRGGIGVATGGSLTNQSVGAISGQIAVDTAYSTGVQVINAGRIKGDNSGGGGVRLATNGMLTNLAGGTISGHIGIAGSYPGSTVDNSGLIAAATTGSGEGVRLSQGGTVTNHPGATIRGAIGVDLGGPALLDNSGRIIGAEGTAVSLGSGFDNRVVMHTGGVFTGVVDGGNTIGATAVSTLELTSNASIGVVSGLGTQFIDFGAVVVDAGATWKFAGGSFVEGVLTNIGTIRSPVVVAAGGMVTNQVTGTITGMNAINATGGDVVVENAGRVIGLKSNGAGVSLNAGGSVTNEASGIISGRISVYGGVGGTVSVLNSGRLSGDSGGGLGVYLKGGGAITNQAGGAIVGYQGIVALGTASTLQNAGRIQGNSTWGAGVSFLLGGSITNQSDGTIIGKQAVYSGLAPLDLINAGRLTGASANGAGARLKDGGSVTNQAGGVISGYNAIVATGEATTIVNSGDVRGAGPGAFGIYLGAGGTIINQTGGSIRGGIGVQVSGGVGTVQNAGLISGSTGTAVALPAGYYNRLILDPGARFVGVVDGGNAIGSTAVSTIELNSGASTGILRGLGTQFVDFAEVTVAAGASWTVQATAGALSAATVVTGSGGTNVLSITTDGAADLGNVSGFPTIRLAAGGNAATLSGTTLEGGPVAIVGGTSGANTIDASSVSVQSGAHALLYVAGGAADSFTGGLEDDTVRATADAISDDTLIGGDGTDTLRVTTAGTFSLAGVSGFETINLSGFSNVTLTDATLSDGPVEVHAVTTGDNTISAADAVASAGKTLAYIPRSGADVFIGGSEDDTIFAGTGMSTFTGGGGADRMVFIADTRPTQTFTDFQSGSDSLMLYGVHAPHGFDLGPTDNALDPASPMAIDPAIFVTDAAGMFSDGSQRLAYNTTDGSLYYSATGTNVGARLVGVLTGAPSLSASDIWFQH